MKNLIKNTILVAVVMVVLGVFLVGCKKDNVEPVVPEVVTPEEPEEEKVLQTAFRLKVYYTKLNLVDTTYRENGGKIVESKVVPKGDISITNFREGKYDLVDSTDFRYYSDVFEYNRNVNGGKWLVKDYTLFWGLYKEGYIHKVVVEMSVDSEIDSTRSRVEKINNYTFIIQFTEITHNVFRDHYLKIWSGYRIKPLYYIEDLIDEPVDTDTYLEFKEVPYYNYESALYK